MMNPQQEVPDCKTILFGFWGERPRDPHGLTARSAGLLFCRGSCDIEAAAKNRGGFWYTIRVLSGRRKPIPIGKTKRCKAIVVRNLGTFFGDDTDAEVCAHTRAPLSVFHHGHPKASYEIGERPFPFLVGCYATERKETWIFATNNLLELELVSRRNSSLHCLIKKWIDAYQVMTSGSLYL